MIYHKHNRRDAQQVEQMDGYRNADSVGYGYQIAVGVRVVAAVLPFQDKPENQGRTERRERIHLALDSREPESVAPCVGKRPCHTASEDYGELLPRELIGIVLHQQPADKMCYGPEQQQDSGRAKQCRHHIDTNCHGRRVGREVDEEPGGKHKYRVAGRMPHFQFVSL